MIKMMRADFEKPRLATAADGAASTVDDGVRRSMQPLPARVVSLAERDHDQPGQTSSVRTIRMDPASLEGLRVWIVDDNAGCAQRDRGSGWKSAIGPSSYRPSLIKTPASAPSFGFAAASVSVKP